MKRIYIRAKIGVLGGDSWYETNHWIALSTETPEDLAVAVARWVEENGEQILNDDDEEGNSDDAD